MKKYIVRKASTRDAINRAIKAGKCRSEADVEAIAARLGDDVFWPGSLPDDETQDAATFLREIGVPANILGYDYMTEAINMVVADRSAIHSMTKTLYPAIAEKFQTTPARAERAMRHGIEMAWERGNLENLHRRFGYTVSPRTGRPTVSEFVARAAEYVKAAPTDNERMEARK